MVVPSAILIGIFIKSSRFSITPGTFTTRRPAPVSMAPAVTSWLLAATSPITVCGFSPYDSMARASIRISTTSSRSPPISTSKTPSIASSLSLISRAEKTSVLSSILPYKAAVRTGNRPREISVTFGSSAFAGRSGFASSTALRTSSRTRSISSPARNSNVTDA